MLPQTRFLFLASFFNGDRAVRAELRRHVNHAASTSMKFVRRDVDGPTMSLGRGAEYLTVLERHILPVYSDISPDRLRATGDRCRDLRVRQPNLVGFNLDRAAVPNRRLCRDRALFTGDLGSAIDKNGAAICSCGWWKEGRKNEGVIRGKAGVSEMYFASVQADATALKRAIRRHVEVTSHGRYERRRQRDRTTSSVRRGVDGRISQVDSGACLQLNRAAPTRHSGSLKLTVVDIKPAATDQGNRSTPI